MKFFTAFQKLYSNHFLLAAMSSLIIIGFIGSVNVFLIAQRPANLYSMFLLLIAVMATMRFLALFLARFPLGRIFESALSGVIVQLLLFIFILNN